MAEGYYLMSLSKKPDLMDFRVLIILQITMESDELLTPQDVRRILQTKHKTPMKLEAVVKIMESLADAKYLVRYSPSGFLSSLETSYYLGPRLHKLEGRRYD